MEHEIWLSTNWATPCSLIMVTFPGGMLCLCLCQLKNSDDAVKDLIITVFMKTFKKTIVWLHVGGSVLFMFWCVNRKDHERRTLENIDHVQEKLQLATATLQQAIGGVNGHLANHQEKVADLKSSLTFFFFSRIKHYSRLSCCLFLTWDNL